jgi:hypothetical protein
MGADVASGGVHCRLLLRGGPNSSMLSCLPSKEVVVLGLSVPVMVSSPLAA